MRVKPFITAPEALARADSRRFAYTRKTAWRTINATQVITALLSHAAIRTQRLVRGVDIIGAMTLDAPMSST